MFGWMRKVLLRRPTEPPSDERSTKAELLLEVEAQVHAQTAQIRRLRAQAAASQSRFKT